MSTKNRENIKGERNTKVLYKYTVLMYCKIAITRA